MPLFVLGYFSLDFLLLLRMSSCLGVALSPVSHSVADLPLPAPGVTNSGAVLPAHTLARLDFVASVSGEAHLGVSSFPQRYLQTGSPAFLVGICRFETLLVAMNSANLGSMLASHSFSRLGIIIPIMDMMQTGLLLLLHSFAKPGSPASIPNEHWLDAPLLLQNSVCLDSLLSAPDHTALGVSLLLHGLARTGSSATTPSTSSMAISSFVRGWACSDLPMSTLNLGHLELAFLMRSHV